MLGISAAIFVKGIKLAGTIHAHHVQSWEFSVPPDNYLPATVFVHNASVYSGGACLIHDLFCSHSRLESKKKKNSIPPFPFLLWNKENHFLNCRAENAHRTENYLLCSCSSIAVVLNCSFWHHIFTLEKLYFLASTPEEHIIHVPGEVTVNETPAEADNTKLKHRFPWVPLRCPSGAAPGFISLSWWSVMTFTWFPPPPLNPLKPH